MKNTTVFKRLLGYLKAYRLPLFFVLLAAVISTGFMVMAPFLVGKSPRPCLPALPTVLFIGRPSSGCCRRWWRCT